MPAPRRADELFAAVLTVAALAEAFLGLTVPVQAWPVWLTVPLVTGPVAVRRLHPRGALAVTLAGLLVQALLDSEIGGGFAEPVALVALLYSAGSRLALRPGLVVLGATLVTMSAVVALAPGAHPANFVFVGTLVLVAWFAGRGARLASERSTLLAERRASQERARIARELHDVVAHHVSAIVVQAGSERRGLTDHRAAQVLADIETAGRLTLTELRRLLGVLRVDGSVPLGPQPCLADLPALLDAARTGGSKATLEVSGRPHQLSSGAELAVYRMVQESLTNVTKHASSARVRVRIHWTEAGLEVEVTDTGGRRGGRVPGTGYGLVAMRERIGLYGGVVDAGPTDQGFRVHAVLPAGSVT